MYIIKRINKTTGQSAFVKRADDSRRACIFQSYRVAAITADKLEKAEQGFHFLADLHENHDCAADLMIHA